VLSFQDSSEHAHVCQQSCSVEQSLSMLCCCLQPAELPQGPNLPERRRDDIPAGDPKEKPGGGNQGDKTREAPPAKPQEKPSK
jgi:hypothetical protein